MYYCICTCRWFWHGTFCGHTEKHWWWSEVLSGKMYCLYKHLIIYSGRVLGMQWYIAWLNTRLTVLEQQSHNAPKHATPNSVPNVTLASYSTPGNSNLAPNPPGGSKFPVHGNTANDITPGDSHTSQTGDDDKNTPLLMIDYTQLFSRGCSQP